MVTVAKTSIHDGGTPTNTTTGAKNVRPPMQSGMRKNNPAPAEPVYDRIVTMLSMNQARYVDIPTIKMDPAHPSGEDGQPSAQTHAVAAPHATMACIRNAKNRMSNLLLHTRAAQETENTVPMHALTVNL